MTIQCENTRMTLTLFYATLVDIGQMLDVTMVFRTSMLRFRTILFELN